MLESRAHGTNVERHPEVIEVAQRVGNDQHLRLAVTHDGRCLELTIDGNDGIDDHAEQRGGDIDPMGVWSFMGAIAHGLLKEGPRQPSASAVKKT
jgi:hypothetical protein